MKKGWKITLITLGSLLGLVVVALVVVCWLLFTPARLTSIVNSLAGKYILCENHFERVDLTLFKTFPDVGLEVKNVVLVNPYTMPDDAPLAAKAVQNDTLAHIGTLTVGIDLMAFLRDDAVVVRQVRLNDVWANLYTGPDGWSNLDIFPASDDTTSSETTIPDSIQLHKIAIHDLSAQYCDLSSQMLLSASGLGLDLKGSWLHEKADVDLSLKVDALAVDMRDSVGQPMLDAALQELCLTVEGDGTADNLAGRLHLTLPDGSVALGGTEYITEGMHASRHDLLDVKIPFRANLDSLSLTLDEATLHLLQYGLSLTGDATLPSDAHPLSLAVDFSTDGSWQVAELLSVLPEMVTSSLDGMAVDARVALDGRVDGVVDEGRLPAVTAHVVLSDGSFSAPDMLPMPVKDIQADLTADLNLSTDEAYKGPSKVNIARFDAKAAHSRVGVTGSVGDLLGDPLVDARVRGKLNLPDLKAFLPDTLPLDMQGSADINLKANSRLSKLTAADLAHINAGGTLAFDKLDVQYDSIHASSPHLNLALQLLSNQKFKDHVIDVHLTGDKLNAEMPGEHLSAYVEHPDLKVSLPNILDSCQPLAAAFCIGFSKVNAEMDSMTVYSDTLLLTGRVRNDTTQDNILKQWNPDVNIDLHRAVLALSNMSEAVRMPHFKFNYKPEACEIEEADIRWGVSDYHLSGKVYGLEDWLSHKAMLHGKVNFSSQYADIDQLLGILSGMGSDADTLAQQREEDHVDKEANPFIVPKDVNVTLNTNITRCVVYGNDLNELNGSVTINDGVAVLDQMGFTCKAARMQLTGIYKSPRVNHLFLGLDFHLLDIQVDELLDMIPTIDTLVPMLSSFKGKADFHLAAECNLNAFYQPKMSTLLGAAAISGKDLIVMDNEKISDIAKLLQFKNWREKDNNISIDSISVEATVFRKEVIVYPFLLNLHNYQLCIGGRHTLDNACNYHLELLKCPLPMRLAVDVSGNLSKPKIALGNVQYAELYKPEKRNDVQTRTLELKSMIRKALEANVR